MTKKTDQQENPEPEEEEEETVDLTGEELQQGAPPPAAEGGITFANQDALQKYVSSIVKSRVKREKQRTQTAAQQAAAAAEEAALAASGEAGKLAEKRGEQLKQVRDELAALNEEHTGVKTSLAEYERVVGDLVKQRTTGLPAYLTEMLAGLTPLKQLEYLNKHAAELERLPRAKPNGQVVPEGTGVPTTPSSAASQQLTDEERRRGSIGVRDYL